MTQAGLVVGDVELVGHDLAERRAGALAEVGLADVERRGVVLRESRSTSRAAGSRGRDTDRRPALARRASGSAATPATLQADDEAARTVLRKSRRVRHAITSLLRCRRFVASGRDRLRRALDGGLDAVVGHAAAQRARHALADLRVGRASGSVEQRLRGHDLAVLAEAALRHLLVDPRLLQRVQLAVLAPALRAW